MAKTLTTKDRRPEVGDILVFLPVRPRAQWYRVRSVAPEEYFYAYEPVNRRLEHEARKWGVRGFRSDMQYIRRADNGPLTTPAEEAR